MKNGQKVNVRVGSVICHSPRSEKPDLGEAFPEHAAVADDRFAYGDPNRILRRRSTPRGVDRNAGI